MSTTTTTTRSGTRTRPQVGARGPGADRIGVHRPDPGGAPTRARRTPSSAAGRPAVQTGRRTCGVISGVAAVVFLGALAS